MRPGYEDLPAAEWTPEEAFVHLQDTFNSNVRLYPDLMEPYVVLLAEQDTRTEKIQIMRRGLRETIKDRR